MKRAMLTLAILAFVSFICAYGESSDAEKTQRKEAAPENSQPGVANSGKFTLIYNVNNSGYIDVCGCKHKEVRQGSLTRRASFLRQLRGTGRQILLLDGGSSLFKIGARVKKEQRHEAVRKAELIVEGYNRMGYRAMAVGPFDLAAGLDVTKELEKKAKFPFLSANLFDKKTGERLFKPQTIIEIAGVRVGVVGLTLETMTKPYLQKIGPNIDARNPQEALKEPLAKLQSEKVDLVVVLSHLREETNQEIMDAYPDIHILVDPYIQYGNHHTWIKDYEWLGRRGDVVLLRGDGQGARLGVLDLELVHGKKPLIEDLELLDLEELVQAGDATPEQKSQLQKWRNFNPFAFQRVSIEPHHLTDPEIDLLVEKWKKNVDPSTVARLEGELPHKSEYVTSQKCMTCHQKQYEWWKNTKHAHALASLERTGDHLRFDCIGCHALGYGKAFLDTTNVGVYADVQCESCHGTNPQHVTEPKTHKFRRITKQDCLVCHNKEQTLKDFRFAQSRRAVACPSSKS